MLYGVLVGIVAGLALGGRLSGLGGLRFHWGRLALAGLAIQIVLFSSPLTDSFGPTGPVIYVASTVLVLIAVIRNIAIPGLALVVAGAVSNLIAIVGNGGFMPASPGALAALGKAPPSGYSNSAVVPDPAFPLLTDIFALPAGLPFANVFSIGDVLISAGIAIAIAWGMRGPRGASDASAGPRPRAMDGPVHPGTSPT